MEMILCAAIKRIKPRDCVRHYKSNDIYDIEIGYRHCDILARFEGEVSKEPDDQGFYTSNGRFVDRKKAYEIAFYANQVEHGILFDESKRLFSEDLY